VNGPDNKGTKARFDLIPPVPLKGVAHVLTHGHEKYDEGDAPGWIEGKSFASYKGAIERHLNAYWSGETHDEDGFHHLAAVAADALILMDMDLRHRGTKFDDRPPSIPQSCPIE
jgi:hypothetical protein